MGLQPRLMSQAMRKLVGIAHESNTLVVFTNQLREKVGLVFGNPETQPGGRALKFNASVRIDLRRREDIKDKQGNIRGIAVKAKIVKNKLAPPLRQAEFDIIYGKGINNLGCILDLAVEYGFIKKSGAWYSHEDNNIGQGRENTIEYLASDLDFTEQLEKEIIEHALGSLS